MTEINKDILFEKIGYKPHAGQIEFHNSKARFRTPVCGRRYGKSTMSGRDLEPQLFLPKHRFWIVGPTYDLGEKEFRVIWDDLIVGMGLGKDKRVRKTYNKRSGEMYIEFPWQTRLEVRSAQHPENLVGESLDGVIMSEAAKHSRDSWERFIRPALTDKRGWATFPTTPEGHNWLYDLWLLGISDTYPDYQSWRFPSWENTAVFPLGREDPEIKLIEQSTSPEWFMQEIGADFSSFVGKIYSEFDESVNVRSCKFHPEWPNYIGMDFGFVNAFAAVEFQVDPMDNIYIWREHYKSYEQLEWHLMTMRNREQPEGYHIDLTFGDAADPEAVSVVNQKFAPCMALPESKTNWRQGVDCVKTFLKMRDIGLEDEYGAPIMRPKLFIDASCTNTIREFANYRVKDGLNSTAREAGSTSQAQKIDDHAMDGFRYACVHLFILGAARHLYEVMPVHSAIDQDIRHVGQAPSTGYFVSDRMEF